MNIFIDTSSLLKLYHKEERTNELLKLLSEKVLNKTFDLENLPTV